jgi:hypothetical protein
MTEKVVAQIVLDEAAHAIDELAHPVAERSGDQRDDHHSGGRPGHAAEWLGGAHPVHSHPEQPRNYTRGRRRQDDEKQPERNLRGIGAVIRQ